MYGSMKTWGTLLAAGIVLGISPAHAATVAFGSANPFYAPSRLPFHAPPFDRIKDEDYQPAIEAGMAQQLAEMRAIADNPPRRPSKTPCVPMEKQRRAARPRHAGVSWRHRRQYRPQAAGGEERARAASSRRTDDAIYLEREIVRARVGDLREARDRPGSMPESLRLVEVTYDEFVHAGANLSEADKAKLKKLMRRPPRCRTPSPNGCWPPTRRGRTDADARGARRHERCAAGRRSAGRAGEAGRRAMCCRCRTPRSSRRSRVLERTLHARRRSSIIPGAAPSAATRTTRATRSPRLAQLRAQRAQLLGFASHAAWALKDQMAKTPEAALEFMARSCRWRPARRAARGQGHPGGDRRRRRRAFHARGLGLGLLRERVRKAQVRPRR